MSQKNPSYNTGWVDHRGSLFIFSKGMSVIDNGKDSKLNTSVLIGVNGAEVKWIEKFEF